jgi:hypothetical protein
MSPRLRRPGTIEETDAQPEWTGAALAEAAALATEDPEDAQAVAFAVACAIRDRDDDALLAMTALLAATAQVPVLPVGALVNVLSALQFAAMLPDDARGGWVPPSHAVGRVVEQGLTASVALREQATAALWTLVDRLLVADWLGREAAQAVASRVDSAELRHALLAPAGRRSA